MAARGTEGQVEIAIMDLSSMAVFKLISKKMDWLAQRQEVLAQNVANVDTPKYKPNDLTPFTFRTALRDSAQLQPAMTNPAHLQLPETPDGPGKEAKERKPYETKPDGNAVDLEEQMYKLSQNSQDFNMVTGLYRKNVGLLKTVLARGS